VGQICAGLRGLRRAKGHAHIIRLWRGGAR
jgi:hypothetical protein